MAKIRRVDFSPDEWLAGTRTLTAEQRGLYWDVCSLIYSRGGPIADDEEWLRKALAVDVRQWRRIRADLIGARKLRVVYVDGLPHLMNDRAEREIEGATGRIDQARKGGKARAAKRAAAQHRPDFSRTSPELVGEVPANRQDVSSNSNELGSANHQPPTTNHQEESSSAAGERPAPPAADIDLAFAEWASIAFELRIPDPGFLNSDRRALLVQRLTECGIEGWRTAMTNLREARWLRDDDDPSKPKRWVNLGTLLKPENFTGLLEGRYVERHEATATRRTNRRGAERSEPSVSDGVAAAFARRSVPSGG